MDTSLGKRCRVTSWVQDRRSGVQLHGRTGTIRWQTNNLDRTPAAAKLTPTPVSGMISAEMS